MAGLLAALWAAGVNTQYSCQDDEPPGDGDALAYIAFSNESDLELFAELVFATMRAEWMWVPRTEWGPPAVRFPPSDIPLIINMCAWRNPPAHDGQGVAEPVRAPCSQSGFPMRCLSLRLPS